MLFYPILTVVNALLDRIATATAFLSYQTVDLPGVSFPWPFPWLPYEPVLVALATGVFATLFFIGLKFARWVYGLIPFVQ